MSTYVIHKSTIDVIGNIWQPGVGTCAITYEPNFHDVKNMYADVGGTYLTRESVERWLLLHSGDFSHVEDFRASIWDGERDWDFDFASEESELTFNDCMFGGDD